MAVTHSVTFCLFVLIFYSLHLNSVSSAASCGQGCKKHTTDDSCAECSDGYFLKTATNGSNVCEPCFQDCLSCTDETGCDQCKPGYFLNETSDGCDTCSQGCTNCTNSAECFECGTGYAVALNETSNGTYCECASGYHEVENQFGNETSCAACSQYCTNCTNATYCEECRRGYFPKENSDGTKICLACPHGCYNCTTSSNCVECNSVGFYYLQNTSGSFCVACPKNKCEKCPSSQCTQCYQGYGFNANGDCVVCQTPHCKRCATETQCTECRDGKYFHSGNNKCDFCPTSCERCTDDSTCTACVTGFVLDGTTCVPCSANCSKCTNEGPGFCDVGECKNPASPRNDTSRKCEPCADNCVKCSKVGLCDAGGCPPGYRRNCKEECEKCTVERCSNCDSDISTCDQCIDRTTYVSSAGACEYCALNCKSCDQHGPGNCDLCKTDCYPAFDVQGNAGRGAIITHCDGFYLNQTTKKCEHCGAADCDDCNVRNIVGECDQCPDGFWSDHTYLCHSCLTLIKNCKICDDEGCITCKSGYDLVDGFCRADSSTQCPSNCETCGGFYTKPLCDSCKTGFGLTPQKTCGSCADYCSNCTLFGAGACDPGSCDFGYNKVGDKCVDIGLYACMKVSNTNSCMECFPEGYHYNSATQLCQNCTNPYCVDCDAHPAICTKCKIGSRLDGTTCIPCEDHCLRCSATECFECETLDVLISKDPQNPVAKAILQPDPSTAKCISLCAGQHGNFYNEPVRDGWCPYEEPHGICIDGNLFRFICRITPLFSAQWHFEYYRRNYTLTNSCVGKARRFSPTVAPPSHYEYNHPFKSYFKEYRDMSKGFVSETLYTTLSADPKVKPKPIDGSVLPIAIEIFIGSIYDMDDIKMQFSTTLWIRIKFRDCRMGYEGFNREYEWITMDNHDYLKFWMPDIYFLGERSNTKHMFSSPNLFMRMYKDGTIITSQKVTVTIACNMKLHRFPLDHQECPILLGSFTYPSTEVSFRWGDGNPLTVHPSAKNLPEFDLVYAENGSCLIRDTFVGNYPCLSVYLEFKRKLGFYLEQVYMPSTLLVMISWIGPWVDKSITGSRVSIGLLTVLTVVTQAVGVNSRLPKVSYMKAVDVWMGACLVQVVGAMLEYCIVNVITRAQEAKDDEEQKVEEEKFKEAVQGRQRFEAIVMRFQYEKRRDKAHFIDLVARGVFPLVFVVFNIIYWTYYLAIFTENPA